MCFPCTFTVSRRGRETFGSVFLCANTKLRQHKKNGLEITHEKCPHTCSSTGAPILRCLQPARLFAVDVGWKILGNVFKVVQKKKNCEATKTV